jgi:hypothetical protein
VLLLVAQLPFGHMWKVASQAVTHAVPLQVTLPFVGGAGHVVHDAPQASTVSLATQVGAAAVPRRQKPGALQTTRQLSVPGFAMLSQAAMPLAGGSGQAAHDVPQLEMLVLATQVPPTAGQRWNPALQVMPQVFDMQTAWALGSAGDAQVTQDAAVPHCRMLSSGKQPLVAGQVCVPEPQTTPHIALTHAVPSGQGVQSTPFWVPQVAEELLLTQTPLHRCQPALQAGTHTPWALQVTLPLSGAAQTVQVLPHEVMLVLPLTTQVAPAPVPQTWKPVLQLTLQVVPLQTGLPLAGSKQAVHPLAVQPDATVLLATHVVGAAAGQPWKPVLQLTLQVVPLQAGAPFAGVAHAVHPVALQPEATLLLATQVAVAPVPHR